MNEIKEGDVKLVPTIDGGELSFEGGQPVMEQGLESAVYISLFSTDFWGNMVSDSGEKLNSGIMQIMNRRSLNNSARLDIQESAKNALSWITSENIASAVSIETYMRTLSILEMTVIIEKPGGAQQFKYEINWDKQEIQTLGRRN